MRRVAVAGGLQDLRRWPDLRFRRLEDRFAARRGLVGEGLAQVFPAGVFAGDLESLTLIELLAECLALGGQFLDPSRHLADVLAGG